MTVLKRKMFRKKGGSKGTGIMASGPELLKRFNGGGVNVPDYRQLTDATRFIKGQSGGVRGSNIMGIQNVGKLPVVNQVTQIPTNFLGQSIFRNIPQGMAAMEASGLGVKGTGKVPEALQFVTLPNGQRIKVLNEDGSTPKSAGPMSLKNPSIARLYREQKEKFLSSPDITKFQDIDPSAIGEPTTPEFTQKKIAAEDKKYEEKITGEDDDDPTAIQKEKSQAQKDYEDELEEQGTTLAEQINLRNFKALDPEKEKTIDDIKAPSLNKKKDSGITVKSLNELSISETFKNSLETDKNSAGKALTPGKTGNASNAPNSKQAEKIINGLDNQDDKENAAASTDLVEKIRKDAVKGQLKTPEEYRNMALEFKGVSKSDSSFDEQKRQALFLRMMEGGLRAFAGNVEYGEAMADAIKGFGSYIGGINKTEAEQENAVTNMAFQLMTSDKQAKQFEQSLQSKFDLQKNQINAELKNLKLRFKSEKELQDERLKLKKQEILINKNSLFAKIRLQEANLKLKEKELGLKESSLLFDQEFKVSEFNLKKFQIDKNLELTEQKINKDSDLVTQFKAAGMWDEEAGKFNKEGRATFLAMKLTKKSPLVINEKANALVGSNLYGFSINDKADAINYHAIIQPQIEALRKEDSFKDLPQDKKNAAIKNLITESGLFSQPTQSITVKNNLVAMLNNSGIKVGSQFTGPDNKLYKRTSENTVEVVQ